MRLIAVGKTSFPFVQVGVEMYLKRLQKMTRFEYHEIPFKAQRGWTEEQVKSEESKKIIQVVGNDRLVLLDIGGRELNSVQFSKLIEKERMISNSLALVIGGPYGFSSSLDNLVFEKLSFGPMTFSHQIFRLMAMEQIYRANSIIKGLPYHHE
jgi:23S rRNA (pseudouridine1915-N3)-methyltransferase